MDDPSFSLLILKDDRDVIIALKPWCVTCIEKKKNCEILSTQTMSSGVMNIWRRETNIVPIRVKCECGNFNEWRDVKEYVSSTDKQCTKTL